MNKSHELLKTKTKNCVDTLFGDATVSIEETLNSLIDIKEHIDMLIESIRVTNS